MLFYRVENESKEGPYNISRSIIEYLKENIKNMDCLEYMYSHPAPFDDLLLRPIWFNFEAELRKSTYSVLNL